MRSERPLLRYVNPAAFALNGCGGSGRVRNGSLKCKPPPLLGTRLLSVRLYIPKSTVILQEYIIIFCAKSYLKSTCGSRGFGAVCTAQKSRSRHIENGSVGAAAPYVQSGSDDMRVRTDENRRFSYSAGFAARERMREAKPVKTRKSGV